MTPAEAVLDVALQADLTSVRRLIVQRGLRGELTSRIPGGETAATLLKRIAPSEDRVKAHRRRAAETVDLPAGWVQAYLGDIIELSYGKSLPEKVRAQGSVPVFGSNGQVGEHDESLVEEPCIVVGRKGSAGAVNLVREPCWPIDTTYYVTPPPGVSIRYLYYLLGSLGLSTLGNSIVPGLNRQDAYEQVVMFPPPPEQMAIAARVDELMALCDELEEKQTHQRKVRVSLNDACLDRLVAAENADDFAEHWARIVENFDVLYDDTDGLRRLRSAVRDLACTGKMSSGSESWRWQTVEAVCQRIVDCPHSTPKWSDAGVICVRTTEFKPGHLDLTKARFVSEATYEERIKRLQPKAGDILFSREGGILGVACLVPEGNRLCLGQRMMLLRAAGDVEPAFLMHVLNSVIVQKHVRLLTTGSAAPHLNVGDVRKFSVPLPPRAEQLRLVGLIGRLEERVTTLDAAVSGRAATAQLLAGALLHAGSRVEGTSGHWPAFTASTRPAEPLSSSA